MDWLIEYIRQKILDAWNDIVKYAPIIWNGIVDIANKITEAIRSINN